MRSPSTPNVTPSLQSTLRKSLFSRWLRKLGGNYLDARRFADRREWQLCGACSCAPRIYRGKSCPSNRHEEISQVFKKSSQNWVDLLCTKRSRCITLIHAMAKPVTNFCHMPRLTRIFATARIWAMEPKTRARTIAVLLSAVRMQLCCQDIWRIQFRKFAID